MSDQTANDGGEQATALVTGAASGIGQAVARQLKSQGWRVTGVDRAPVAKPDADGTDHIIADLADPDDCARVCRTIRGRRWTALVHAAGIMRSDAHADTWRSGGVELWLIHVAAAARLVDAIAAAMPDRRGRIVLISSRAARGRAGRMLYAASKAAMDGLALSLAQDLIARGITVNVVAPAQPTRRCWPTRSVAMRRSPCPRSDALSMPRRSPPRSAFCSAPMQGPSPARLCINAPAPR
jgi:3-oxoacyl-[acyl-carrier protein] reductase